jgi:hypothetical protein
MWGDVKAVRGIMEVERKMMGRLAVKVRCD